MKDSCCSSDLLQERTVFFGLLQCLGQFLYKADFTLYIVHKKQGCWKDRLVKFVTISTPSSANNKKCLLLNQISLLDHLSFRSKLIEVSAVQPNIANFGRSLLGGYCSSYVPDFVLQGIGSDEKLRQCLYSDLSHAVQVRYLHSF